MSDEVQSQLPTFDQILVANNGDIRGVSVKPNTLVPAELVFEPVHNGKRVTFRQADHRVLCAFIASQGMMSNLNTTVAVYTGMQELLRSELTNAVTKEEAQVEDAERAIQDLEKTVAWLRRSIQVIKETEATRQRAYAVVRLAQDACCLIQNEASSFKGMKVEEMNSQKDKTGAEHTDT